MKPTCATVIEVPATPKNDDTGKTHRRKIIRALIGVFVFVVVVCAILVSVYFGMKVAEENEDKEYVIIYKQAGAEVERGSVLVTDIETVFTTDTGIATADFTKDLVTFKGMSGKMPWTDCYVTNLNESDFLPPTKFKTEYQDAQIIIEMEDNRVRSYEVTDIILNNKALGPKTNDMCQGRSTYFLRELKDEVVRSKRGHFHLHFRVFKAHVHIHVRW